MNLQLVKASKAFGSDELFENLSFDVKDGEKIAIIGRNGCGKTTLLKILSGEIVPDKGELYRSRDLSLGVLSQATLVDEDVTVEGLLLKLYEPLFELERQLETVAHSLNAESDEKTLSLYAELQHRFEEMGGYTFKSEMMSVFTQFGFTEADLKRPVMSFSGGQKTRIAFVRLLLSKPDVMLLDEPTNHLDMSTIEWLETYLSHYDKAVVFVSHDRMFIDHIAKTVYELEYGVLTRYSGNYSAYMAQKALNQEKQLSAYKRQQKDIERLEALIEKFRYKKSKAKFAQSKITYLDRMERIDNPKADQKNFKARFHARLRGGKHVLTCKDLEIGYHQVLARINLELLQGKHCAVIGPNGHAKSTFLKTVISKIPALGGEFLLGHQIEIGYFDQELLDYTNTKTVLEDLWDAYPELTHTEVRTVLGSFLFTADEVFKQVNVLSGGEKVRLALAKLMLQEANFLILDEPTNHLDILGKEALEEALREYEGTLLFVSHDRYFIQKMAKSVLSIEAGQAQFYPLTFDEIQEQVKESEPVQKKAEKAQERSLSRSRQLKQLSKLEEAITLKEEELEIAREKRFDPFYYHDHNNMKALDDEIDGIHNQINALMKEWESIHESIEESVQKEPDKV